MNIDEDKTFHYHHLYKNWQLELLYLILLNISTVCPGSSDPPEKILNIFASENEAYTIY